MRDIDVILDDIEGLILDPNMDIDPTAVDRFKRLHRELLEAEGYTINQTRCPLCGDLLDDKDTHNYRNWEFKLVGGKGQIIYQCVRCNIEVPMNVTNPRDAANMN